MSDQLLIRPAREDDCEFIAELVPSLLEFVSPAWHDPTSFVPGFRDVLVNAVRGQDAQSTVLIAQGADGTPLGFISLRLGEDVVGTARAHVADLAVTAGARRVGVGTALMSAAEAWARERGLPAISLDVWSTNERAQAFYRRLGYGAESLHLLKRLD
jgi:ribosomal protein S18 acetylase RimI-like enzyme